MFRIGILVGWLALIARTAEAKRLFAYHGAEHKAIWTYESRLPLTVENARRFTTEHPRCGTSFLFVVVARGGGPPRAAAPLGAGGVAASARCRPLFLLGLKILLAFPVAAIAYELQKRSARPDCPRLLRALVSPGLWLQRITTREPSDDQLEIALLALERALAREEGRPRTCRRRAGVPGLPGRAGEPRRRRARRCPGAAAAGRLTRVGSTSAPRRTRAAL